MMLLLIVCVSAVAAGGTAGGGPVETAAAEHNTLTAVDCSPPPQTCLEGREDSELLQLLAPPPKNQYRCYETSLVTEEDETNNTATLCEARVTSPEQRPTLLISGPYHLQQYSLHHLISPTTAPSQLYPNNQLCKYHVACTEFDSYLSLSVSGLDLEPAAGTLCSDNSVCRDQLHITYPTGSQCTLCGSDLVCRETGRWQDPLTVLNGSPGLHLTFQSNRQGRGCGFQLLATCTRRTFFESSNCTLPRPLSPSPPSNPFPPDFTKRAAAGAGINTSVAEGNDTRARRYFNQRGIHVPGQGRVMYGDRQVTVEVRGVVVHSFPGISVLQVYNDIEGSLTFYSSANGRTFPGYGVLSVGLGVIQYTQESVPSQFKPNESEKRMILLLHRGIEARQGEGRPGQCVSKLTSEERAEVEDAALEYGRACNGFLRAAACAYQQLYMSRVSTDCLANIPILPFHPPILPLHPSDPGSGLSN